MLVLLTREHGRVAALAKGAHRPDSPCLGRIDFLNEVDFTLSPDRGGLRLLLRIQLRRERRPLREPQRFLAASHLAWLTDVAWTSADKEPELFDLLQGGLQLLERCPLPAIPAVVLGLELRLLEHLGGLPDLERCASCGAALTTGAGPGRDAPGLYCPQHRNRQLHFPADGLALLRRLHTAPGRELPALAAAADLPAISWLPARWLEAAVEQRSPLRALLFRQRSQPPDAAENTRRPPPDPRTC